MHLFIVFLAACGAPPSEADVDACEHLRKTGRALTVSASESGAPALRVDHQRNDMTLVGLSMGHGGFASVSLVEGQVLSVYIDRDIPLKVTNSSGVAVEFKKIEKTTSACSEVKAKYTMDLKPGTYLFNFGPTRETTVRLVLEKENPSEK
jgi:hypothetical protein